MASSINTDIKSASVGAWVEMIMEIPRGDGSKAQAEAISRELIRTITAIRQSELPRHEAAAAVRGASRQRLTTLDRRWRCWCLELILKCYVETPGVFWPLFLEWWPDGEGQLSKWSRIVGTALKFGNAVEYMLPIEKEWLNSLSDRVTIYRGQIAGRRAGISWTTDRERAVWFAGRFLYGGEPAVITGRVKRADIIAVFEERNESEVLVLPSRVRGRSVQILACP